MLPRRRFLQLSLGAAVLLVFAGGGAALVRTGLAKGHLTAPSREIFLAIANAVLEGSLAALPETRQDQLRGHLQRVDETISALPASTHVELSRLLALLASAPGRVLLAGLNTPWAEAALAEIQDSLESMRMSRHGVRQQAYHALRDLTNAAFYAAPDSWPLMGYPGPVAM